MSDDALIQFDPKELAEIEAILKGFPKGFPRVVSRALNRAAATFRSKVTHEASQQLKLPLRVVKSRVYQSPRARPTSLNTTVRIRQKGFSLWHYDPVGGKPQDRGVTTTRGVMMSIPHAFIAIIQKGRWQVGNKKRTRVSSVAAPGADYRLVRSGQQYPGVYVRKGRARFPVIAQLSPDVEQVIKRAGKWDFYLAQMLRNLELRLMHETELLLTGGTWRSQASQLQQSWAEWRAEMGATEFR